MGGELAAKGDAGNWTKMGNIGKVGGEE